MKKDKGIVKIVIPEIAVNDQLICEIISGMFVDSVFLVNNKNMLINEFNFLPIVLPEL